MLHTAKGRSGTKVTELDRYNPITDQCFLMCDGDHISVFLLTCSSTTLTMAYCHLMMSYDVIIVKWVVLPTTTCTDPSSPLEACTFCTVCSLSSCPVTQLSLLLLGTINWEEMNDVINTNTLSDAQYTTCHICTYTHLQFVHMHCHFSNINADISLRNVRIFSRFSGQGSFSIS